MLSSPWPSGGRTGQPGVEHIHQPRKFHGAAPVSSLEQPQEVETVARLLQMEKLRLREGKWLASQAARECKRVLKPGCIKVSERGHGVCVHKCPAAQRAASWDRGAQSPLAGHTHALGPLPPSPGPRGAPRRLDYPVGSNALMKRPNKD